MATWWTRVRCRAGLYDKVKFLVEEFGGKITAHAYTINGVLTVEPDFPNREQCRLFELAVELEIETLEVS